MKESKSFGLEGSLVVRHPEDLFLEVLSYNTVVAKMHVVWKDRKAFVEQYTKNRYVIPFPTMGDKFEVDTFKVVDYFKSRCFPETRFNKDEILEAMGLKHYQPTKIIKMTHGIQNEDYVWLRFKGEEGLRYEDVGLREVPEDWRNAQDSVLQ